MSVLDDIFDWIDELLKCAWNHKIVSCLIIVAFGIAIIINSIMYNESIKYEPIESSFPTVQEDINLPYDKSTSYNESVSIGSILEDSVGEVSESASEISNIENVLSKAEDATGKSGNLLIPEGASGYGLEDLHVYEWKKTYSQFFGLFPGDEIEVVVVMGNSALSGKIGAFSIGVLADTSIYHLT